MWTPVRPTGQTGESRLLGAGPLERGICYTRHAGVDDDYGKDAGGRTSVWAIACAGEKMADNGNGSYAMGDKGKKDKEKGRKQKMQKKEQKSKGKLAKQQRKIP